MKRYFDPSAGKRISKKKALQIVYDKGVMLVKERMTLSEAKMRYPGAKIT